VRYLTALARRTFPFAETAHLADDRFRLSARHRRGDCFGDGGIIGALRPDD
jgi:hypothetical protein